MGKIFLKSSLLTFIIIDLISIGTIIFIILAQNFGKYSQIFDVGGSILSILRFHRIIRYFLRLRSKIWKKTPSILILECVTYIILYAYFMILSYIGLYYTRSHDHTNGKFRLQLNNFWEKIYQVDIKKINSGIQTGII